MPVNATIKLFLFFLCLRLYSLLSYECLECPNLNFCLKKTHAYTRAYLRILRISKIKYFVQEFINKYKIIFYIFFGNFCEVAFMGWPTLFLHFRLVVYCTKCSTFIIIHKFGQEPLHNIYNTI